MGRLRNYFLNHYPRTDFHELNQDWMISMLFDMINQVENFVEMNSVKYADPIQWDITRQYEKNTIVIDEITGTAYISSKPVPKGVALSRTEYWNVIFDIGRFITLASQNFANSYEALVTTTATMPTDQDKWVVWNSILYRAKNDIHVGDMYVIDGNIEKYTVEMFFDELAHLIAEETEARIEADTVLHGEIVDESVARENADATLQDNIDAEATARENADDVLQGNIDAEATARENADATLQGNIDAEATARENADTTLQGNIDAEATARENADNALQGNIDAVYNTLDNKINNLSTYKKTYVNVKNFGAIGDGTNHPLSEFYQSLPEAKAVYPFANALTDSIDRCAIQKAIINSNCVYIPQGVYIIDDTIVLPQATPTSIVGDGQRDTILNSIMTSGFMIEYNRNTSYNGKLTEIKDIQLISLTGGAGIKYYGVIDGSTRYEDNWLNVTNCDFRGLTYGINLFAAGNCHFIDIYGNGCEILVYLNRAASFIHMTRVFTIDCGSLLWANDPVDDGVSNGIEMRECEGIFCRNATIRVLGWQGVYLERCSADLSTTQGDNIFIYKCEDVSITNCWCAGQGIVNSIGIRIWQSRDVYVSGCTVQNVEFGIRVDGLGTWNTAINIIGIVFEGCSKNGIIVVDTRSVNVSKCNFLDNYSMQGTDAPIYLSNSGWCIITENKFVNAEYSLLTTGGVATNNIFSLPKF